MADLCIVPSIYEPFGLVALEAMASGCLCVVADTGGLREVVPGDGTVGLRFPAQDVARPARQPRAACSATTRARAKMVAEAREHVLRFDWAEVARQTAGVYARLVAGRARRALRGASPAEPALRPVGAPAAAPTARPRVARAAARASRRAPIAFHAEPLTGGGAVQARVARNPLSGQRRRRRADVEQIRVEAEHLRGAPGQLQAVGMLGAAAVQDPGGAGRQRTPDHVPRIGGQRRRGDAVDVRTVPDREAPTAAQGLHDRRAR